MLEAYEATRDIEVVDKPIETPVAPMIGKHIAARLRLSCRCCARVWACSTA